MKRKANALFKSLISLILCFSMLVGTTFAWFTDSVKSGINTIAAGNLDVELYHTNAAVTDERVNAETKLFMDLQGNPILWEPGVVSYENLRVANEGDLALAYQLAINTANENFILDPANNTQYGLSQILKVGVVEGGITATDRAGVVAAVKETDWTTLATFLRSGSLLPVDGQNQQTWGVVIYWQPGEDDNRWNLNNGKVLSEGETLQIDLGVKLVATQEVYESDAFGDNYDTEAKAFAFPNFVGGSASAAVVPNDQGQTTAAVTMDAGVVSATVPAGAQLAAGVTKLTLNVSMLGASGSNITLGEDEAMRSLDVHVDGLAENNTVPVTVTLKEAAPKGLNMGNYKVYHVEKDGTKEMTLVDASADFTAHNQFKYDPATGDVTLYMATFSEIAVVAEPPKWEGEFDYSWYTNAVAPVDGEATTEYIIANADQLAAFGAIVGGMNGQSRDSFAGKSVKLISDINLGDKENANESLIFHPIGYYYNENSSAPSSTVYSFEGAFDGNGHTIANFYQNTWEIKGDYDGNYYKDAMGLFGYVVNGTVKNLTVDNFSSDGEFTPTGVIAAYAVNSTFENIAITNCNPRVYNTGNGGIVGIGGNSSDTSEKKMTFTNITVDNSNIISALWGSWDVACGGIMGMFRGYSEVTFTNCHVGAQIDVYNDVCGNYQYYWYRYAGMIIGSLRGRNTTDSEGYTVPDMTGIKAVGCTVHFGTWNDYYYCELVANSLASYTHDHQFSRLTQIQNVSEIRDENGNWKTTGNYILMNGKTHTDTCYHIMKDADGKLYEHKHDVADATNPEITEVVNGTTVLKENNQRIFLPFNQLFQGDGWGVKTIPIYEGTKLNELYPDLDITILERDIADSVDKFVKADEQPDSVVAGTEYEVSKFFKAKTDAKLAIEGSKVQVFVSPVGDESVVYAEYVANAEDWTKGTVKFYGRGTAEVTITDYYYCNPYTITVEVVGNGILYRVGNAGNDNGTTYDVTYKDIARLLTGKEEYTTFEVHNKQSRSTALTVDDDEVNDRIDFTGTGIVGVKINDVQYYLEVVDAVNTVKATPATSNNVVLLNDIGSGFTVDNGYTFYGNGFTLKYTGDGRYLKNGLKQGIVMVQNSGILDNLRIEASIYPTAFMYYGATTMGEYVQQDSNPKEESTNGPRYYYQLSAVATYGAATIQNCYIYGGRTNIYVNTGDVAIKDTIMECGVVSNVQIQSTNEYTVTFENVTTIQYQIEATIGDTSKIMLGAGVIIGPDTETNPTIVLEGKFKQYNWVTAEDSEAISSNTTKTIIDTALSQTEFNHTINGKTAANLGIIYMNQNDRSIHNKTGLPYKDKNVNISSATGAVYSVQGATTDQIYSDYINADRNTVNGDYLPTFDFDLGDQEISYDGSEDTRYLYGDANGVKALYQDGDAALTLDLSKLATIYKYTGKNYTYTAVCKDASGKELASTNNVVTLSAQGSYTLEFTVYDNIFYNEKGEVIDKTVERTFSVPLSLTVKEANVKNAVVNITKTDLDGVYTTVNINDYKLRINFLDCISVTDYDNKGNGTTVSLSSNIASVSLTPASVNVFTTASTITVTYTDGRVLTVNLSKISGSSPGTKTAVVNTSGGLYFITEGALNNKPTESSSQNKCTITSVSFKGNSGSTVTNDTDVTVTWDLGSSSGTSPCVTADTKVTLADGTTKRIDELTYEDNLLVWNFFEGKYDVSRPAIIFDHGADNNTVIKLKFSDGTTVKVVNMHQFFDADLRRLVTINEETVSSYVGHRFSKLDGSGSSYVKLVDYKITKEYVEAWGVMSAGHYNIITEGMLSADFDIKDVELFNYFEVGKDMRFDQKKMQADIAKYGLYTYKDFADYLTYEQFVAFNVQYFKIPVAKGLYTYEGILDLIEQYLN